MGNFEKLSVLVIGVIIVMILVVALYTWTDDPAADAPSDAGLISDAPRVTEPPAEDPWKDIVDPAPPAPPKAVAVVKERPDEPGPKVEDEVKDLPAKTTDDLAEEKPLETSEERTYTVKEGDTLGGIALTTLGSTKYWKLIADRNNADPMKLRPGMTLIIPSVEGRAVAPNKGTPDVAVGGPVRAGGSYTIRKGDTIQKISQAAYKTIERWTDIWFANMERISDPRDLRPGMTIDIPN